MNESLESRLARVKFSSSTVGADRIHYVNADDVRVVLGRFPIEIWNRLRAVHFNVEAVVHALSAMSTKDDGKSLCVLSRLA